MRAAAPAVVALLAFAVTADRCRRKAWFGLKTPQQLEKRSIADRKAYAEPALPPLRLRLPDADDPYTDIEGEEIHASIEEIVRITVDQRPAGARYWGRIAGSAAERATAEYVAERFRDFGLTDVRTEPVVGGAQWWPNDWSVTLVGDPAYGQGTEDYPLTSAFPAIQLGTGAMNVAMASKRNWSMSGSVTRWICWG